MGVLAKKGIFNGKKVPISGIGTALPASKTIDKIAQRYFEGSDLELIAEKLLLKEPLSPKDADVLLKTASIPALIKLSGIKYGALPSIKYVPVLYLSMDELFKNYSGLQVRKKLISQIRSYGYDNLRIWISLRGFSTLPLSLGDLIKEVKQELPQVRFIAPSCSRIIAELAANGKISPGSDMQGPVREVIENLWQAGIYRLGESGCKDALSVCHQFGMPNFIVSRVTHLDPSRFIKELVMIRALNESAPVVHSWSPGVEDYVTTNPSREYLVLKALGVGSLFLDNVPYRRANSRAVSLGALALTARLGANAYIHGAVDNRTANALNLYPIEHLLTNFEYLA
jgi:hypothetical protein